MSFGWSQNDHGKLWAWGPSTLGPGGLRDLSRATGGFWEEDKKAHIGLSSGTCQHCGAEDIDRHHVHWKCPSINAHRQHTTLCSIDQDILPDCVKVGMPPALSHSFQGPYWNESLCANHAHSKCGAELIGIPMGVHARGAQAEDHILRTAINDKQVRADPICARQIFGMLKGLQSKPIMPLPKDCSRTPPEQINVYTDGSWQFPLARHFCTWRSRSMVAEANFSQP